MYTGRDGCGIGIDLRLQRRQVSPIGQRLVGKKYARVGSLRRSWSGGGAGRRKLQIVENR